MKRAILLPLLTASFIVATSHVAFWFAAESDPLARDGRACSVLVLGYPAKSDGSSSGVARFRVGAGVRVYRESGCSKLVLSGGAVRNEHVEADAMAAYAESLGVPEADIALERRARSTWENVGCTAQLVPSGHVLVVSDSLHARRAARYVCRQDPGLCERFLPRGVAPPIRSIWSPLVAANELRVYVRDLLLYRSGVAKSSPGCVGEGNDPSS